MRCDKFLKDLFKCANLIPHLKYSVGENLNVITRLCILIFIIMLTIGTIKVSLIFLCISLVVIIFIYIINKNMTSEHFKLLHKSNMQQPFCDDNYTFPQDNDTYFSINPNSIPVNDKYIPVYKNQAGNSPISNYTSINKNLMGEASKKTLIPPVLAQRSHDLDYWKTNNLITHSHINSMSQIDDYTSGYQVSTCKSSNDNNMILFNNEPKIYRADETKNKDGYFCNENRSKYKKLNNNNLDEYEYEIKEDFKHVNTINLGQELIDKYYDPDQINIDLPANLPVGKCQKDINMKPYNEQVFTQTIEPGIYSKSEVIEPINSLIGISFDQQFEPIKTQVYENGDIMFTAEDPLQQRPNKLNLREETINESNVYDPRHTGYGSIDRSYTNSILGRTDFYYDDINAVRMPNYICRSNIDFMPEAQTYGPMKSTDNTEYIRNLANQQFLTSTLQFRTDLQKSLMRKNNINAYQNRLYPKYTYGYSK